MRTEAEISRALDEAYSDMDMAFAAIDGIVHETKSIELQLLAGVIRKARDEVGSFDLPAAMRRLPATSPEVSQ